MGVESNATTGFLCICIPTLRQYSKIDNPGSEYLMPLTYWFGCKKSSMDDYKIVARFESTKDHDTLHIFCRVFRREKIET